VSARKGKDPKEQKARKKARKDKREEKQRKLEEVVKAAVDELSALTGGTEPTVDSAGNTGAVTGVRPVSDQFGRKANAIKRTMAAVCEAAGRKLRSE
jgi:hypothetical protein